MHELNRSTRLAVGIGLSAAAGVALLYLATSRKRKHDAARQPARDDRDRSGFPRSHDEMRGAARPDPEMPDDMRTPQALAGYSGA